MKTYVKCAVYKFREYLGTFVVLAGYFITPNDGHGYLKPDPCPKRER